MAASPLTTPGLTGGSAPTATVGALTGPVTSLNTMPRTVTGRSGTSDALGGIPGGFQDPFVNLLTGHNMFGKGDKEKKPKIPLANKIYNKGHATLQAYNALLGPTQDLLLAAGQGDLRQFETLAPGYVNAITNADPLQAALRKRTNEVTLGDLSGQLSESIRREIAQGNRGAWSARGLAQSPASATEELMSLGTAGWNRQQQAIGNAMRLLGINQQIIGDPLLAVTGRPSGVHGIGDVPQDARNILLNEDQQRRNKEAADAANRTALIGAGISAVGNVAGAAGGLI